MATIPPWAIRPLKVVFFALLFLLLFTLSMLIGTSDTGPGEKLVLLLMAAAVYGLAVPVHRIGSRRN